MARKAAARKAASKGSRGGSRKKLNDWQKFVKAHKGQHKTLKQLSVLYKRAEQKGVKRAVKKEVKQVKRAEKKASKKVSKCTQADCKKKGKICNKKTGNCINDTAANRKRLGLAAKKAVAKKAVVKRAVKKDVKRAAKRVSKTNCVALGGSKSCPKGKVCDRDTKRCRDPKKGGRPKARK